MTSFVDPSRVFESKSPEMQQFLRTVSPHDPATGKCATRGCNVNEVGFTDNLSVQEYYISGMCQNCQDFVFKQ